MSQSVHGVYCVVFQGRNIALSGVTALVRRDRLKRFLALDDAQSSVRDGPWHYGATTWNACFLKRMCHTVDMAFMLLEN